MNDAEAVIIMVDSNIQRTHIPPSEKGFAYKMKLDAINKQGNRTDLTSCQLVRKLNSAQEIAKNTEDSERQIYTYLVSELLEMVDEGKIRMSPDVGLSYLDEACQRDFM